jgi:hypothetical protein
VADGAEADGAEEGAWATTNGAGAAFVFGAAGAGALFLAGGLGGWNRPGIEITVGWCRPEDARVGGTAARASDRPAGGFSCTTPAAASVSPPLPLRITRLPAGMVTVAPRATDTVPSGPMVAPGIVMACEMTVSTTFPEEFLAARTVLTWKSAWCEVLLLPDTRIAVPRPAMPASAKTANDLIRDIPTSAETDL